MKMNTKNVQPLRTYQLDLIRTIDDMDWEGENTEMLEEELKTVTERVEAGELWQTTF